LRAPHTSMILVIPQPHVLGPKYERLQSPRNSDEFRIGESQARPIHDLRRGRQSAPEFVWALWMIPRTPPSQSHKVTKYRDNIGYPRYGESWLSGITNMVKPPAIYRLSPINHFWHFWCDFCNFCVFCIFLKFLGAFFLNLYVFNYNEDFLCAFIFDSLWFFLFFVYIFCMICFF